VLFQVEACGTAVTFFCRDLLECASTLIGAECCKLGDTFFATSPPMDGSSPVISEQVHGTNFRKAESAARAALPAGARLWMFCGLCLWTDGTPVTKSMSTSVEPVWLWIGNVAASERNRPGHSIVVAFIDTLKGLVVKRDARPSSKVPKDAIAMVKTALKDEMHHVMLRPLRTAGPGGNDTDRFGAPYSAVDGPGFPARGGQIVDQLLPGGDNLHSPVVCALIQVVVDGKEAVALLHTFQNWDMGSGAPPELCGRHDLPVDATALRDPVIWETENKLIYDAFEEWFLDKPGCGTQSAWVAMKKKHGLRGGYPGLCGLSLSPLELVVFAERLHVRCLGVGRAMMLMSESVFCDVMMACLSRHMAALRSPGGSLWFPKVGLWGPFLTGEQHRLLHEAYPLVLELARRENPDVWTEENQLVLNAAAAYAEWNAVCDKPCLNHPADFDVGAVELAIAPAPSSLKECRCGQTLRGCGKPLDVPDASVHDPRIPTARRQWPSSTLSSYSRYGRCARPSRVRAASTKSQRRTSVRVAQSPRRTPPLGSPVVHETAGPPPPMQSTGSRLATLLSTPGLSMAPPRCT